MQIKDLGASPSFLVLGCGSSILGLKMARKLLTLWGYRRSEDIVWIHKINDKHCKEKKENILKSAFKFCNSLFEGGKEHFLLGIKGQLNKKENDNFVHTNIDCDVVVTDDSFL